MNAPALTEARPAAAEERKVRVTQVGTPNPTLLAQTLLWLYERHQREREGEQEKQP